MAETRKVVINAKHGGFGLSEAAYEKLIEWGVPVRRYVPQRRDPETMRYLPEPANEGEVIFDRELTLAEDQDETYRIYQRARREGSRVFGTRYWDDWTARSREHPLIVRLVEEMGDAANDFVAKLRIVEIPADVEYSIEEYDGLEWIAEKHRTWHADA